MGDINQLHGALTETWRINHRINLRLLDALTDEQLAAVIAHEIGHVTARHSMKRLEASYGSMVAVIGAIAAGGQAAGGVVGGIRIPGHAATALIARLLAFARALIAIGFLAHHAFHHVHHRAAGLAACGRSRPWS